VPGRFSNRGIVRIAGIYLCSAAICTVLATHGKAQFVDVHVYRLGGDAVLHSRNLYRLRYVNLPFTYPPFAAILCTALAALPWSTAAAAMALANCLALPVILYLALRLPPVSGHFSEPARWELAFAAAAAAIWLEPVRTALGYGQVDLLIALCVLFDLSLPDEARVKGMAIGLAAGLKLTPAIFAVYLLLTRRYRAAAVAATTFAATVAVGAIAEPDSSARYWTVMFASPGHVAPVQDAENQSLLGALTRALHTTHVGWLWLPMAGIVALTGLALARLAGREGDEAAGFSICAITGLLISPISWTHHWVIAVPALLLAAVTVYAGAAGRSRVATLACAGAIVVVAVIGWVRLARVVPGSDWLRLSPAGVATSEVYVVAGLTALVVAGCAAYRRLSDPAGTMTVTMTARPAGRAPWLAKPSPLLRGARSR
jgi:alpha-1,2-mannosyltransferase